MKKLLIVAMVFVSLSLAAQMSGWKGEVFFSQEETSLQQSSSGYVKLSSSYNYNFLKSSESDSVIGYASTTQTTETLSVSKRTVTCKINGVSVKKEEITEKQVTSTLEAESNSAQATLGVYSAMYEDQREVSLTVHPFAGTIYITDLTTITGGCKEVAPKFKTSQYPYQTLPKTILAKGMVINNEGSLTLKGSNDGFDYSFEYTTIDCSAIEKQLDVLTSQLEESQNVIFDQGILLASSRAAAMTDLLSPPGDGVIFISSVQAEEILWAQSLGSFTLGYDDFDKLAKYAKNYKDSTVIQSLLSILPIALTIVENGGAGIVTYQSDIKGVISQLTAFVAKHQIWTQKKKELEICLNGAQL